MIKALHKNQSSFAHLHAVAGLRPSHHWAWPGDRPDLRLCTTRIYGNRSHPLPDMAL